MWSYLLCRNLLLNKTARYKAFVVVVQSSSHVWFFVTPWTSASQVFSSLTISRSLPKFMFIASVMPSSHLILWCPLLLPSIFPSIRDFSHESTVCIRWPEYWSFSFNISPSSEYSGLISLQIDWFGLLDVQGNLKMFKGINSSVVRFLYGPTLTTVHDHWEEHSLNYMDLPLSAE